MTAAAKYEVRIKRSAEKDLDQLPRSHADAIAAAILKLEDNPRPRGSKRLRATDGYRIRHGNYRVLYTIDDRFRLVEIVAIGHRRDIYRKI